MNSDGYVLMEINEDGEGKIKDNQIHWHDFRLEHISVSDSGIKEHLLSQLAEEKLRDVLVMVHFRYHFEPSDFYEVDGGEDEFILQSFTVAKTDYKEFYRMILTEELKIATNGYHEGLNLLNVTSIGDNYYRNLIQEWEEFYDEDFQPFEPTKAEYDFDKFLNEWSNK